MDNMRRFETINDYNIFNNNETLHPLVSVVDLSKAAPRQGSRMYFGFYTIFLKDVYELEHAIDKHSKRLIVSNIEILLNYCLRFYDRQFITRENVHKGILERFEHLLNEYFQTEKPHSIGLPSVAY